MALTPESEQEFSEVSGVPLLIPLVWLQEMTPLGERLLVSGSSRSLPGEDKSSPWTMSSDAVCHPSLNNLDIIELFHGSQSSSGSSSSSKATLTMRFLFAVFVLLLPGGCRGRSPWSSSLLEQIERGADDQKANSLENEIAMLKRLAEEDQRELRQRELETNEQDLEKRRGDGVRPRAFLERFGYLPVVPKNVSHEPTSMRRAILRMQRMYHIKETGELNEETIAMMRRPRCGLPDFTPDEDDKQEESNGQNTNIAQNFNVPGYKWRKTHLKWKTRNYHRLLSEGVIRRAFSQAFKHWSDASGLTFAESGGEADINMYFASGVHSDGSYNAFDGMNGVLAHAFYPESGEVHFDADEHWTDGENRGTNLMIVATHELGHALGIGHSQVQGALMSPTYQGYESNFRLRDDDIRAIQSLYGGPHQHPGTLPDHAPSDRPPSTRPPSPDEPPQTCELVFKAMTQTYDSSVYVFNGRWMWRMSDYGLDQGFPLTISTYYENSPEDISATVFSWRTYYTYFFKNKRIWRYYGFQLVDEKEVETHGYPANPNAAIDSGDGGSIYLIKDGYVWTFDEHQTDIRSPEPISFENLFPGAPTEFDSVVRLHDNLRFIYFFKGLYYMKYDEEAKRVLDGYPKPKAGPWMGPACGAEPYTPK